MSLRKASVRPTKMDLALHGTLSNHGIVIKLTQGPPDSGELLQKFRKIRTGIYDAPDGQRNIPVGLGYIS